MLTVELSNDHIFYLSNMVSVIILLFYLLLIVQEFYKPQKDKGLHSIISAGLTIFFIWIAYLLNLPWWISPIIVFLLGICKEIVDLINPKKRRFEFMDIFANLTGINVISLIYCLYIYF